LDVKKKNSILKYIFKEGVNSQDISFLCNGLSCMINAGISVSQALNIIASQCNKKTLRESLYRVERNVSRGESIHKSLKKESDMYPLFMNEMIKIGEESGKLDKILKNLSEYYDKQDKLFNKVKSAITYPLVVLTSSFFIILFLMAKIIPNFIDTLLSIGGDIPFITQVTLDFYSFLRTNFYLINIILFTIMIAIYQYSRTNEGKLYFDNIKIRIPYLRRYYNNFVLYKFSVSLSMLIEAGFNIIKALETVISVLDNKVIENKINNCIEDIKQGESMNSSFKKQELGNELFLSLISIGEETGKVEQMLSKLGGILENELEEYLKKLLSLMEPMIIIFLALFVGVFIIAAFMPIINIMDSIA
jgi:type IV pilus assembly protein PilC